LKNQVCISSRFESDKGQGRQPQTSQNLQH
jgi:hypothetical protein